MKYDAFFRSQASKPVVKSVTDNDVRDAFNHAHPAPSFGFSSTDSSLYVQAVVLDESSVIVCDRNMKWKIPFSIKDGEIIFDDSKKQEVEQATIYRPVDKLMSKSDDDDAETDIEEDLFHPDAGPEGRKPGAKPQVRETARPPGPRIIEMDVDQDEIARDDDDVLRPAGGDA